MSYIGADVLAEWRVVPKDVASALLTSEESESANNKEIKGETDADVTEEGSDENSAKGNGEERHECRDKENGRGIDDGVGEEPGATRRLEPRKRGKLIY